MSTPSENALIRVNKSTIVRSNIAPSQWMRAGFSTASQLAPGLTSLVAERLFRKTQRRRARPGERDVLEGATAMTLAGMKAWSWGRGPTVLLVHGWNGRATQLGAFVSPLVARGYRVVAFDAFGHGESPGNYLSLPELATCIRQVADGLGGVYAVVAHSLGGAATTFALAKGLEIERAVFVSPPADPREFLAIFSAALGVSDEVRDAHEAADSKSASKPRWRACERRRWHRRCGRPFSSSTTETTKKSPRAWDKALPRPGRMPSSCSRKAWDISEFFATKL